MERRRRRTIACVPFLLFFQLLVDAQPTGPLATHYDLIEGAALRSLNLYNGGDDTITINDPTSESLYTFQAKNGLELSAFFQELETDCRVTFGSSQGSLTWLLDIDIRRSYIKSRRNPPTERCRVVKQYKNLYTQRVRGGKGRFQSELISRLDDACAGKELIFAGHGLGGAAAVVWGVAYEQASPWVITFGQPPVFQAPPFTAPGVYNVPSDYQRHACPLLDKPVTPGSVHKKYVPFINAESFNPILVLHYDFMPHLNLLLYGLIVYVPDEIDPCVVEAAARVAESHASVRGNLGSPYGNHYILPPATYFPNQLVYKVNEKQTFEAAFPNKLAMEMVLSPELIRPDPPVDAAFCNGTVPAIHAMTTYYNKIAALASSGHFDVGFTSHVACNFNYECQEQVCIASNSTEVGTCRDPTLRPPPGTPCTQPAGSPCVAPSQCCQGEFCNAGRMCGGCKNKQTCASVNDCCPTPGVAVKCKGMKMMKCKF